METAFGFTVYEASTGEIYICQKIQCCSVLHTRRQMARRGVIEVITLVGKDWPVRYLILLRPCFATLSGSKTQKKPDSRANCPEFDLLNRVNFDGSILTSGFESTNPEPYFHGVAFAHGDGRVQPKRTAQVISPRRIPSRRRLVKTIKITVAREEGTMYRART